ncbi:MAG: hypothetical protein OEY19_07905 [Gammaproteobacteria bacterium]|nr:hypothetical protein [Gammaproteobacteria bacterium]MDH5630339.1 hypothetical protein [Gammaproteobacteria bacterium]
MNKKMLSHLVIKTAKVRNQLFKTCFSLLLVIVQISVISAQTQSNSDGNKLQAANNNQNSEPQRNFNVFFSANDGMTNRADLISQKFESNFENTNVVLTNTDQLAPLDIKNQIRSDDNACVVSVGVKATEAVLATREKIKVFSTELPRMHLDKLRQMYQQFNIDLTGIYQEQSFERQLKLIKAINDKTESAHLFLGMSDKYYLQEFKRTAEDNQIELHYRILQPSSSISKYLDLNSNSSMLIITNNEKVYKPYQIEELVKIAFEKQLYLIGNKFQDAENGSLIAIYTPEDKLVDEISESVSAYCLQYQTILPNYAKSFALAVNKKINQNMAIEELDGDKLMEAMRQMESKNE